MNPLCTCVCVVMFASFVSQMNCVVAVVVIVYLFVCTKCACTYACMCVCGFIPSFLTSDGIKIILKYSVVVSAADQYTNT